MPVTWKGQHIITEATQKEVVVDKYGVASATIYYWGPFDQAVAYVTAKKTHPDYGWLSRTSGNISRTEGTSCDIRIAFEGVPPETDEKSYRTSGSTSSEPIESHPKFVEKIAGTKSSPKNGAEFDDNGKFTGWAATSLKYGTKQYLSAGLNYEEIHVTGNVGQAYKLSDLGDKVVPPTSNVIPQVTQGRDWLLISGTAEQLGTKGGRITRVYRLSGKRGWDMDIYST